MNQPRHHTPARGFSLVEIVISLAILAVAMSTIFLTLSYASKSTAESTGKSQAIEILVQTFADINAANINRFLKSPQYSIAAPDGDTPERRDLLWFDGEGRRVADRQDAYFRCELTYHQDSRHTDLLHLHGRVAWPARAEEGREPHQTELLTSLLLP
jgi:prepilin-type N-terminal cleavage/methylation domain-containing protein